MSDHVLDSIEETLVSATADIRTLLVDRDYTAEFNPSGERQLAADTAADNLLAERLGGLESVGAYASEEQETIQDHGTGLSIAVDPLDGSSNLVSNNPMGTIVSVYDQSLPAPASALRAAWYVLYGPITTLVALRDQTVTEAIIDDGSIIKRSALEIPDDPTIYGFGGRVPEWSSEVTALVKEFESELKLRYGGAMVADVNQVLSYGGIFSYPAVESAPNGKLRLQFEAIPIAAIMEAAGGASTTGTKPITAVDPSKLHQRTPLFVGNRSLITRVENEFQPNL